MVLYQHTSSVTKGVETRQRAATSESLRSAQKQGSSSESQQHPVPLDCCCSQDQHVSGASARVSPLGVGLTRSMCPRPKPRLGARGKAGARSEFSTSPHPAGTPLTSAPFPTIPVCTEIISNSKQTFKHSSGQGITPGPQASSLQLFAAQAMV